MSLKDLFYENFYREYTNERKFFKDIYKFFTPSYNSDEINEFVSHEKAHAEKAKSLGYNIECYSIRIRTIKFFPTTFKCKTLFAHVHIDRKPTSEDFVQLCLAPENPSFEDKWKASKPSLFYSKLRNDFQ